MARLTGKVALITGAAGGQGQAEVELFVREEAAVVLTDIDVVAGEALAQRTKGQELCSCARTWPTRRLGRRSLRRLWRSSASCTCWSTTPVRSRARPSSTPRSRHGAALSRST